MLNRYKYNSYDPLSRSFEQLFDLAGDLITNKPYSKDGRSSLSYFREVKSEDGSSRYLAEMDLPGVKLENLEVECQDRVVTIKAERKTETSSYSYNKSFTLSDKLDPNSLEASLEDGVLTLSASEYRQEESKSKKVAVTVKK